MERGRRLRPSLDGGRLRFLERAATIGVFGELLSVALPTEPGAAGGDALSLGLNVHAFAEIPDGRVLSIENRVYQGTWNRLVIVDEAAREKRWLIPGATEFFVLPDASAAVADVVTGASGYDIVRAPIPPR